MMIINEIKTLRDLKEEFSAKFPHLKLEFYSASHVANEGNTNAQILEDNQSLSEVRTLHNEGDMSIDGHYITSNFEQAFKEKFGVNVQVFRKSGDIWLQTTTTDNWTLSEQERAAQKYIK